MKKKLLAGVTMALCLGLLSGCGKNKLAVETDNLILSIGEVNENSGDLIADAERHYSALTEDQKNDVENYLTLIEAREEYDALMENLEQEAELQASIDEAQSVVDAIDALSSKDCYSKSELDRIQNNYDSLSDSAKEQVTNYDDFKNILDNPTRVEQIGVNICQILHDSLYNPDSFGLFELTLIDATMDSQYEYATIVIDYNGMNRMGGQVRKTEHYVLYGEDAHWNSLISDLNNDMSSYYSLRDKISGNHTKYQLDPDRILSFVK